MLAKMSRNCTLVAQRKALPDRIYRVNRNSRKSGMRVSINKFYKQIVDRLSIDC